MLANCYFVLFLSFVFSSSCLLRSCLGSRPLLPCSPVCGYFPSVAAFTPYRALCIGYRTSSMGYRTSSIAYRDRRQCYWVWDIGYRVSDFGYRVSGSGDRSPGFCRRYLSPRYMQGIQATTHRYMLYFCLGKSCRTMATGVIMQ